ncbi:MAG TPA: translation initiation factor IF-6 [Methanomassiliicoccales archaeon]|nr:translation initiation factor IF-6 [Methanomassiliicoccales archaeon]
MMKLSSYDGNPYIGVYSVANECFSLVPLNSAKTIILDIEECLQVTVEKASIAGTNLLGSLIAVNSYGAVVSGMANDGELEVIEKHVPATRLDDKLNAAGNNILVNDKAALVNPRLGKKAIKGIEGTLQVEAVQGTVAGSNTVGSACVVTNKGILCHPKTSEAELKMLTSLFKVPASIGTLNYGTALVGACIIANAKGAVIGSKSTPIELGRVEDTLGFI